MSNIVFHVDLDCFFAAVEARDNPAYRGKPLVVGADPRGGSGRGVVSTCSYEARNFGIHSAMPISRAYQLCPGAIFVRPDYEKYKAVSREVMDLVRENATVFQQASIDEAYFEAPVSTWDEARVLADRLRLEVKGRVGITCSIGAGPTRILAKIASDVQKPDGTTVVTPSNLKTVLGPLDITRIPGIGKKTRKFYAGKGVETIGDLLSLSRGKLVYLFGPERGTWLFKASRGLDYRPLQPGNHRRKSISKERTFFPDKEDKQEVLSKLRELNALLHEKMEKKKIMYRTISIKVRFSGFVTCTRSRSFSKPVLDQGLAWNVASRLFEEFIPDPRKIRLVGLRFSSLEFPDGNQRSILDFLGESCGGAA